MAELIYSERALEDLDRLATFLLEDAPELAADTVELIREAVTVLRHHPDIGRPAEAGLRELVISRGRTGYLALYAYLPEQDTVLILAVRHQREVAYLPGA